MKNGLYKWLLMVFALHALSACTGIPKGVEAVSAINPDRYLGSWYEIARLDHSFERGLEKVTATYTTNPDGSIKVINTGYDPENKNWKSAEGKAVFIDDVNKDQTRTGRLKVSFFGPFYSSYNIIDLDIEHYQYAVVCGPNKSYFWILSRVPTLDKKKLDQLVQKAKSLGFKTDQFIYVKH
jgi:apolipoprotein D and lipocalin family protein